MRLDKKYLEIWRIEFKLLSSPVLIGLSFVLKIFVCHFIFIAFFNEDISLYTTYPTLKPFNYGTKYIRI